MASREKSSSVRSRSRFDRLVLLWDSSRSSVLDWDWVLESEAMSKLSVFQSRSMSWLSVLELSCIPVSDQVCLLLVASREKSSSVRSMSRFDRLVLLWDSSRSSVLDWDWVLESEAMSKLSVFQSRSMS